MWPNTVKRTTKIKAGYKKMPLLVHNPEQCEAESYM
jgi:hypothetical protein